MEVEAKYIIPDRETFERLMALEALEGYALRHVGRQDLVDRYFDTAVRALWQGGYAMRLREEPKARRWRGTLKGLGGGPNEGGAVHRREEYELDVPPGALPATWPSSPARDLALRLSGEQPLEEMFAVRQVRYKRQVWEREAKAAGRKQSAEGGDERAGPGHGATDDHPQLQGAGGRQTKDEGPLHDSKDKGDGSGQAASGESIDAGEEEARLVAELSLDEVMLAPSGGDRELVSFELEVELAADGLPEDLAALGAALEGLGLKPQGRSKFERGLALLGGARQEEQEAGGRRQEAESRDEGDGGRRATDDLEAEAAEGEEASAAAERPAEGWGNEATEIRSEAETGGAGERQKGAEGEEEALQEAEAQGVDEQGAAQVGREAGTDTEEAGQAPTGAGTKRGKTPGVRGEQTMAEAGRLVLRFHFERMAANEAGARAGEDIEAVHDMRVATRRQRAALALFAGYFKPKAIRPFRRALKAIAGRLGAVRDLDVLLAAAREYQAGLPPANAAGLGEVLAAWEAKREAARAALLAHLDSGEYRSFKKAYGKFLSKPGAGVAGRGDDPAAPVLVRDVLPARLWDHYGAVRAYSALLPGAEVPTLHALRIAGKRLRYALEFFAEALDPAIQDNIVAVVALQDHLGALHDADVTLAQLHVFLQAGEARPSPEAVLAVGGYLRVQQATLRQLQRTVGRPWKKVAGRKFRRVLGRAAAGL
jgi:CHAD domain-containing protein